MAGPRQHVHASAFHLRKFQDAKKRICRVTRSGQIQPTVPTKAAIEKNLITDGSEPSGDIFWFERSLGDLEGRIAPKIADAMASLAAGQAPSIDNEDAFTCYLAIQFARSMIQGDWIESVKRQNPNLAHDNAIRARADVLPIDYEYLKNNYPNACFYLCGPLAHPNLPIIPFETGGIEGVMIAMSPDVLFIRAADSSFELDDPPLFYWTTLLGMTSPWDVVFCAPADAPLISSALKSLVV